MSVVLDLRRGITMYLLTTQLPGNTYVVVVVVVGRVSYITDMLTAMLRTRSDDTQKTKEHTTN